MSFNKIIIVGNLGRDPELRYTPQGIAVCSFTMATNEKRKDKSGELQDVTTWFKVTLWRNQAENASKYLTKGSPVYIEGRLNIEEWTDRENVNRFTLDVQATEMQFIGGKDSGERHEEHPAQQNANAETHSGPPQEASSVTSVGAEPGKTVSIPDDDIPF